MQTREQWLQQAVQEFFRPHFFSMSGIELPQDIKVSIGFPSSGGTKTKGRNIGQCWMREHSTDGAVHIFISPLLVNVNDILTVLAHELIHSLGIYDHKAFFGRIGAEIGLLPPWKSATADEWLIGLFESVVDAKCGEYPHGGIHLDLITSHSGEKKDKCRMIKCSCPKCGYTLRTVRTWIDIAIPKCPVCDLHMEV